MDGWGRLKWAGGGEGVINPSCTKGVGMNSQRFFKHNSA